MARVVPERGRQEFRSTAEWHFYEACRRQLPDHIVVLHGGRYLLRDPERWDDDGEIDFLIIDPNRGYLVVEVKGGGIVIEREDWTSIDRYGRRHRLKESPLKQAMTRKHGLIDKLKKAGVNTRRPRFCYAVCFPDCRVEADLSFEAPRDAIIDSEDLDNLPAAVERCFGGPQARGYVKPEEIDRVIELFYPSVEVPRARLGVLIRRGEREMARLTREQVRVLDYFSRNHRVLVTGCAGSGKTFLALEQARRLARAGYHVLFTCQRPELAEWIESHFSRNAGLSREQRERILAIDVYSFVTRWGETEGILEIGTPTGSDEVCVCYVPELILGPCYERAVRSFEFTRSFAESNAHIYGVTNVPSDIHDPIPLHGGAWAGEEFFADALHHILQRSTHRFDALIVDEAQSIPTLMWEGLLQSLQNPSRSPVWVFADDNDLVACEPMPFAEAAEVEAQQGNVSDPAWAAWLEQCGGPFVRVRLSECLRNALPIQEYALRYYLGGGPVRRAGLPGPEPEVVQLPEGQDLRETVDRIVHRLVHEERIEPRDIVVLSPAPVEGSEFPASWRGPVSGLTYRREVSPNEHKRNVIRVETVAGFRGLESPVVVFVEPDGLSHGVDDDLDELELMYIALTRATQHLVIVRQGLPAQVGLEDLVAALEQRLRDPLGFPRDVRPRAEALLDQAKSAMREADKLTTDIIRSKAVDQYNSVLAEFSIRLAGRPPVTLVIRNPKALPPQAAAQPVSAETWSLEVDRPEPLYIDPGLVRALLRQLDDYTEAIRTLLLSSEHSFTES